MTFKYTLSKMTPQSSAIEEIYYNSHDKNLYLVMKGGSGYRYKMVPESEFLGLSAASSVGRYYATHIKPNYGPSEYLGYFNGLDDEFESVPYNPVQDSFSVTSAPSPYLVPNTTSGVGMPQALHYRSENVTLTSSRAKYRNDYTVTFEYDGKVREHKVQANSLDEAIVFVQTFAEMLDLDFKIKAVTIHFD